MSPARRGRGWIPYFVLAISLAATGVGAWMVRTAAREQDRARFEYAVERTGNAIQNRLDVYAAQLWNVAALFQTGGIPSQPQLAEYLARLEMTTRYPGVQGIGFSLRLLEKDREAIEKAARAFEPGFHVWPLEGEGVTPGEHHTILLLEPLDERNRRALGYDMHTEPVRRAAMDMARDLGQLMVSGRVELVQEGTDAAKQAGFLMYMPLYRTQHGPLPATVGERREKLYGYVYAPFRADDLFRGIFQGDPHADVDFRMYDGAAASPALLLHDSTRFHGGWSWTGTGELETERPMTVGRRQWTIRYAARPEFFRASNRGLAWAVLAAGGLVSVLFFALTRGQVGALDKERRARGQVDEARAAAEASAAAAGESAANAKRLAAMAAHSAQVAEAASRAKDRFLAVLSHELRTPLAPVMMAASALEMDDRLPADLTEEARVIRRNVALEARLIDDLLDLTRIAKGKVQFRLEDVDLHEVIAAAVKVATEDGVAAGKGVAVVTDLRAGRRVVCGDAARLQQVFWNLVQNGIKFTPAGGEVRVRTEDVDGRVRATVRDTGIGIAADALPKVFDAFEQASQEVTREFGGLGLGLTISRLLVEGQGGTIRALSDGKGKGAEFVVEFPVAGVAAEDGGGANGDGGGSRPRAARRPAPGRRLNVLLVEDHADTSRTLARLLRQEGYDVTTATSMAAAVAAGRAARFDLIISDLGLPDGSGLEVMGTLGGPGGANAGVPAIALTGFGMEEDVRQTAAAGFCQHLTKPVDMAVLREAIDRAMSAATPAANDGAAGGTDGSANGHG